MTKKERVAYQLGLRDGAAMLRLFIMPSYTVAWHEDTPVGTRELNNIYAELADKIETIEPGDFSEEYFARKEKLKNA